MKEQIKYMKPIMKWAGGKTQMLKDIMPRIPVHYGKYIEPFIGGGALFFALKPEVAVIADSNPELINMYRQVADSVDEVIKYLKKYENTSEMFYQVRALEWTDLSPAEAAARTLYLNKTCYNGLYRVNRKGQFNAPFGKYKNPTICDEEALKEASELLGRTTIVCDDYLKVLEEYAKPGDFVFLDPPYVPISDYADFKRYTKEQFYEDDHRALAEEVKRLQKIGCHALLTNSNHPLVRELYSEFPIDTIQTKRYISSDATKRKGEDVIVTIEPKFKVTILEDIPKISERVRDYPPTRFMGSKNKLLPEIWAVSSRFDFNTVLDLFSGSGVVSYMFKAQGKSVISNDYMAMSAAFTKAMVENNGTTLSADEAKALMNENYATDHFVAETFAGLYYSDQDNQLIDIIRTNIWRMNDEYKQAIAMSALIRACIKKRPRGIFTYTGDRYNDGRRDLAITLKEQFLGAVESINQAVFDNGKSNYSYQSDAMLLKIASPDLVYIDPPYYSPLSDNEYVRRYHFVEGLARDWKGVEIQQTTQTKKFKSYPTPFSTRDGAANAFDELFKRYASSILVVSYSSNSLPNQTEMMELMGRYKNNVTVVPVDYTYSFGNQKDVKTHRNRVQEYLFIGY